VDTLLADAVELTAKQNLQIDADNRVDGVIYSRLHRF
jgi:hypothetical protein